jgi:hypothetical protein
MDIQMYFIPATRTEPWVDDEFLTGYAPGNSDQSLSLNRIV